KKITFSWRFCFDNWFDLYLLICLVLDFMSLNFYPTTFDNKPQRSRFAKMFYDRSRYVALYSSCLMVCNANRKFFSVFLPFGHGIGLVIHVFILSTWLNNTLIYPRVYYINVDNNMNQREASGKQIAEKPDQIKRINDNWYQVKSQSLKFDSWYDVVSSERGLV